MKTQKRPFYGWWIVLTTTVICFAMASNPFRIILKDLMEEFGYGRGMVSLAYSLTTIAAGITGLFIGRMVVKRSPKPFLIAGVIGEGLTLLALSLSPNIWYLYAFFFINGIAMAAGGVIPMFTILSRWFKRKWGMVVGITMTGFAMGGMILSPIIGLIVENIGWRATFIFSGSLFLLIALPLVILLVKDSPEGLGLLPDGDSPSSVSSTGSTASTTVVQSIPVSPFYYLKDYRLWMIGVCFALTAIGDMAITQHQVAFITDMNISATVAASALGFTLGLSGIAQLASGWLADRVYSRYVSILFNIIALAGIIILINATDMSGIWLFVIVYGLGTGASQTLLPVVITDAFGVASFSVVFSIVDIFYKCGSIIGTPMAGFIFDAMGSYQRVFLLVAIFYALAMVCIYFSFGVRPRPILKASQKR